MILLVSSILMGLIGTAFMSLYMYFVGTFTQQSLNVIRILGTMVTFQTTEEKGLSPRPISSEVGMILHFVVGTMLSFIFLVFARLDLLQPTFAQGLVFGFISGAFGITIWKMFFDMHPNPPAVPVNNYLLNLWGAHLLFGWGIWIGYRLISILNSVDII